MTSLLRYNITIRLRRAVTKINPAQFKGKVIRRVSPPLASGCQTVGDGASCSAMACRSFPARFGRRWNGVSPCAPAEWMRYEAPRWCWRGSAAPPPLQVEVERHGTQRRIEKGAFVGIVIANNRLLTRHRHLMLMEGAEHPSAI